MYIFCEILSTYINRCGKTEVQLAKKCGFARSYIALIKNGQRIPTRQKLEVLITSLELSPAEKRDLLKQWESAKYGEIHTMRIERFVGILNLFQSFTSKSTLKYVNNIKFANVEFKKIIYGYENIKWAVSKIIMDEAAAKEKYVTFTDQKSDLIVSSASYKTYINITINHIVCLESCQQNHYSQIKNIDILKDCMVASLLCKHYRPMYYYGSTHTLESLGMPVTITGSTAILEITGNKNTALFHNDLGTVKLFECLNEKKLNECCCLWDNLPYKEALQKGFEMYESSDQIYLFGDQSFLEFERKYVPWASDLKIKKKTILYFSLDGLKRCLNDKNIKYLDGQKRTLLIHMLLRSIREGYCEAHCIDSKYLQVPAGLIVTAAEGKPATIRYEPFRKYYKINENSVSNTIWLVLSKLSESIYVFNENDTEKLIWQLYQPYRDKYL